MPWAAPTIGVYGLVRVGGFVKVWGRDWTPTPSPFARAFAVEAGPSGILWSGSAWMSFFTTVRLAGIAAPLTAGLGPLRLPHRGMPAGEANLVIRPEAIRLAAADAQTGLPATVRTATCMGGHVEYHFATEAGPLFAVIADPRALHGPGTAVRLAFAPYGVNLVAS